MATNMTGIGSVSEIARLQKITLLDPRRAQFHNIVVNFQKNSITESSNQVTLKLACNYQLEVVNPISLDEKKAELEHQMNLDIQRFEFQKKRRK